MRDLVRVWKRSTLRVAAAVGLLTGAVPFQAFAQTTGDPAEDAKVHLGPLALTPRFAVRNLGVDSNVFNTPDAPTKDFTATFGPGVDTWLRIGRARLSTQTVVEWSYFRTADEQRAINTTQLLRLDLDLATLIPYIKGGVINTRQRPNLEIDDRVQQQRTTAGAGARLRLGGRSRLDVDLLREQIDFGDGSIDEAGLTLALNRDVTEGGVAFQVDLTPLTTFVLRTGVSSDVFEFARLRDSNSVTVLPGLEMKPSALIAGKAFVGFRRFDAKSALVPDFTGVVAAVDVGYVMRESTRFGAKVDRNLDYSFQADRPYYIATTATFDLKQALGYSWDVVGRMGRARLAYRGLAGEAGADADGQADRITTFGIGFGRRLGESIRVGIDIDHGRRQSDTAFRGYEGYKVGGSFTYGY